MKVGKIKSLMLAIFGCFYAIIAYSATSLFSDYGQIQNVQNYSTNPFWTPNSPYNQKLPQPVYVQGTAISNEECVKVLQSSVAMQCMARDNCKNTSLSDIRPAVIVQLSNLPNKAYSTACIGYLDSVYESYVAQYGNNAPTQRVAFPTGTVPNPAVNNNTAPNIKNPYEIKTPQWQQEINERSQELQSLQQQNGAGNERLSANPFPTTYADLSFSERMENEAAGYAPYKDAKAYRELKVYGTDQYCNEAEHRNTPKCMEYRCKSDNTYSTTAECVAWLCQNDTTYKNKNKNTCEPQKQQTAKKTTGGGGGVKNKNKICATVDKKQVCCDSTNETCLKEKCQIDDFKTKNADHCAPYELCAIVGTDTTPTCCDVNQIECITNLCTNEEFKNKHAADALCEQKTGGATESADDKETDLALNTALNLCPKGLEKRDPAYLFANISTPNLESATELARILFMCRFIENGKPNKDYKKYNIQNPAHGQDTAQTGYEYIRFVNKDDSSNFYNIYFPNTNASQMLDIYHVEAIWRAVCLLAGGKQYGWHQDDHTASYTKDYFCWYDKNAADPVKADYIRFTFNRIFAKSKVKEEALITTCTTTNSSVQCSHQ